MFGKMQMLAMYATGLGALTFMATAANFLFDNNKEEKKNDIPVVGDRVRIHSLNLKPDFNGLEGKVVEYNTTTQRFNIVLNQNGTVVSLKATNLTVLATRAAAAAAARAASGAGGGAASAAAGVLNTSTHPDPPPAGECEDDEDDRVDTDTNPDLPPAPTREAGSAKAPGVWAPALGKYIFIDNNHETFDARLEFDNNIMLFLTAVDYADLPLEHSKWGVPVCLRYADGKTEDLNTLKVKKGLSQLSFASQLPGSVWLDFAPTGAVGAAASAPAASAGRKRKRAPHAGPEASPRVPPVGHKKRRREWTN
jgi:hypothetical protein